MGFQSSRSIYYIYTPIASHRAITFYNRILKVYRNDEKDYIWAYKIQEDLLIDVFNIFAPRVMQF